MAAFKSIGHGCASNNYVLPIREAVSLRRPTDGNLEFKDSIKVRGIIKGKLA